MVDVEHEDARWDLACELLAHPNASYGAVDERGVYVPTPPELAALVAGGTGTVVDRVGRTALDLVVPVDRAAIMDCWDRTRRTGAGSTPIHFIDAEDDSAWILHILDLRSRCGAFVTISVPTGDATEVPAPRAAPPAPPPRLARVRKDQGAIILGVDAAFTELLGWSEEEVAGRRSSEFVHEDDQDLAISGWLEMLASPGLSRRIRLRHLRKDGTWAWFELTNNNLLDEQGQVLCDMVDVSDEMAAYEALRAREQLLQRLAEALPLGVVQTDAAGAICYANSRTTDLFGSAAHVEQLVAAVRTDGDADRLRAAFGSVLAGAPGAEAEVCLADARTHLSVVVRRLDEAGTTTGAVACFTDVSDNLRLRDELRRRAEIDPLTGSLNRGALLDRLSTAVGAEGPGVAVVFVDLDGFKEVNDRSGHETGDQILVRVSEVLREHCREHDVVGRYGGDEFLVTCSRVGSPQEARRLAQRFAAALDRHGLGASVGVAWAAPGAQSVRQLVAAADAAMYAAKATRDGQVVLAS